MARSHFEYFSPLSLSEAIEILRKYGKDARIMAGGTDLLIGLKQGVIAPRAVISLKNIKDLDYITYDASDGLTIGATALLADVVNHPDIIKYYPSVATAAQCTANVQIRNMGTVVGNICNASPSADNVPMLLVMESLLVIAGPDGERSLPLADFFKGPGQTAIGTYEIVTAVKVPVPPKHSGTAYLSLSARGQVDCSAVGVGVMITMNGDKCADVRIAVGACAPVPMRVPDVENILKGKKFSNINIEKTARIAVEKMSPITDLRASASYRSKMVEVLVKRALIEAKTRVK